MTGTNAHAPVWDMFEAYRQVKINKKFFKFTGFQWEVKYTTHAFHSVQHQHLKGIQNLRSYKQIALGVYPEIFKHGRPLWITIQMIWAIHSDINQMEFVTFLQLLTELEIPTMEKVTPPTQFPKILGFLFNIKIEHFTYLQKRYQHHQSYKRNVIKNTQPKEISHYQRSIRMVWPSILSIKSVLTQFRFNLNETMRLG